MKTISKKHSIFEIYRRILLPDASPLSAEAARVYLNFSFPDEDRERMHELAAKARDGALTAEETLEIRSYEEISDLLSLMKSRARLRLKSSPDQNGSTH